MDITTYTHWMQHDVAEFIRIMFTEKLRSSFEPKGKDRDILAIPEVYQHPGGQFWVVIRKGHIVGTAAIRPFSHKVAYFRRLYVLPEQQGFGIGSNLLATRIAWAKERGFTTAVLDTTRKSSKALRLFAEAGFVETEPFPTDHPVEVFMELKL